MELPFSYFIWNLVVVSEISREQFLYSQVFTSVTILIEHEKKNQ